jgi:hypothetical protein
MKKIFIFFAIAILTGFISYADLLDIPEVKVYGERKVKVETVNKQALPFENEYLNPSIINTKRDLPAFEVLDKRMTREDMGARLEATAGTYLEGYLLGYTRGNFHPFEVGLDFNINSNAEDSSIQLFSRTSIENFHVNAAVYAAKTANTVYRFNIGNIHDIIDFDFNGVFSDSLIGVADISYRYSPFVFNLQFETADIDFNIKAFYEKYPFQAGAVFYDKKIYPELVYFFPIFDLYVKGNLLNKTGIAYLYCQSAQYLREYASSDAYYRIEFGQSKKSLPLSAIYSHYLSNSSNYIGIKVAHENLFFEFEYPIESEYEYMIRTGINATMSESIYTNIYGYIKGIGNNFGGTGDHFIGIENYFIGIDLGYEIKNNMMIGVNGSYINGLSVEDGFEIAGYIFAAF